jgi:photosynthetic reaction center cytochrome c subunit
MSLGLRISIAATAGAAVALAVTSFQYPPVHSVQYGYRGVGMVEVNNPATERAKLAANQVPPPEDPQPPNGQPASAAFSNVQVLKDVDSAEFMRLMSAMSTWVAPKESCTYCHTDDPAADTLYTKVVARRMLQMVEHINSTWKAHVGTTGVTCYTCHRGAAVPANIWFDDSTLGVQGQAQAALGKNHPAPAIGFASLPSSVFTPFLDHSDDIRVVSTTALPADDKRDIKDTEWTYGLMMHISEALGVNCTYCHNSRSFTDWNQSTPQRATAWYGIRMVRDLNDAYLDPLQATFPKNRLGPGGDGPKINCATCHQGVAKPLYGVSMVKDYPELTGVSGAPDAAPATPPTYKP